MERVDKSLQLCLEHFWVTKWLAGEQQMLRDVVSLFCHERAELRNHVKFRQRL